ncbi:uncharacterized protein LOC120354565 [Nilaparvata lugens]|uniref:uncharacterized protein LOC120354565 n=1 Tax=Nilaparvata lugens TaxID=108931 RepID=UPI00193E18DD|nr:uncharacterized protein LOC120354565 [Nilaparvata lugens]
MTIDFSAAVLVRKFKKKKKYLGILLDPHLRRCLQWMDGDVGGRRSGLLFNVVGNVLGLLVSGARLYGWPLYAMDVVLGLAGDVVRSLSAFCRVRRDFSLDIFG